MMATDTDLLTPEEVADMLRVSLRALQQWRGRRQGPPWVRLGHTTVRYPRQELLAWLKEQRHEGGRG